MSYLSSQQYGHLLNPINPRRVHQVQGMSHLEAYDVRAHLNRIFGFANWSAEVIGMDLVSERHHQNKNGKDAVSIVYRAGLRLTVNAIDGTVLATYTEWAAGDANSFPIFKLGDAHDFAIKTAESQALKRAAVNLGDQFGLSLYNNGNLNGIVVGTLNQVKVEEPVDPVDKDAPEVTPEQAPVEGEVAEEDRPAPEAKAQANPDDVVRQNLPALVENGDPVRLAAFGKWARGAGVTDPVMAEITAAYNHATAAQAA